MTRSSPLVFSWHKCTGSFDQCEWGGRFATASTGDLRFGPLRSTLGSKRLWPVQIKRSPVPIGRPDTQHAFSSGTPRADIRFSQAGLSACLSVCICPSAKNTWHATNRLARIQCESLAFSWGNLILYQCQRRISAKKIKEREFWK